MARASNLFSGDPPAGAQSVGPGPVRFSSLDHWENCDFERALSAFRASARICIENAASEKHVSPRLLDVLKHASGVGPGDARYFFETEFQPVTFTPGGEAFFTAFYEPEFEGSLRQDSTFRHPLYRAPDDLVSVDDPAEKPAGKRYGRRSAQGVFPHFSRSEVMAGALEGKGLELVYLKSDIDAYFAHIQGAVRIKLPDGSFRRYGFSGKSGDPYRSIGQKLITMLDIVPHRMTMSFLRSWLEENPEKRPALFAHNPSFIYFRELENADPDEGPVAAAGVPLTAGASLAIDRTLYPFHIPFFVSGKLPLGPENRTIDYAGLHIAQDTGSAITGYGRADLFTGTGLTAGKQAGPVRHPGRLIALLPKGSGPENLSAG